MRKSLRVQAFSFVHRVGIVLIYLFAKAAEMSANLWREVRRIRGGGKRVDTYGFYPLNSRFPLFVRLAQTRDRRPLRKEERQSSYYGVSFSAYSQFTDSVLLHMWVHLCRRDIPVSRNSFARCYARHLRIFLCKHALSYKLFTLILNSPFSILNY